MFLLTVTWKSGDVSRYTVGADTLVTFTRDLTDYSHVVRRYAVTPL